MTHHEAHHQTRHWNAWRRLILVWTAVIAALLHQTFSLGVVAALVIAFAIAAAISWFAHLAVNDENQHGPNDNDETSS